MDFQAVLSSASAAFVLADVRNTNNFYAWPAAARQEHQSLGRLLQVVHDHAAPNPLSLSSLLALVACDHAHLVARDAYNRAEKSHFPGEQPWPKKSLEVHDALKRLLDAINMATCNSDNLQSSELHTCTPVPACWVADHRLAEISPEGTQAWLYGAHHSDYGTVPLYRHPSPVSLMTMATVVQEWTDTYDALRAALPPNGQSQGDAKEVHQKIDDLNELMVALKGTLKLSS